MQSQKKAKAGRTPLLKEAMLCTQTLQLRVGSISEKRFRQELEGGLVKGVDVVRKENRAHGHTHQEEQTSLASKACQSPEYVNDIQTKIFPSHQMHNFA